MTLRRLHAAMNRAFYSTRWDAGVVFEHLAEVWAGRESASALTEHCVRLVEEGL